MFLSKLHYYTRVPINWPFWYIDWYGVIIIVIMMDLEFCSGLETLIWFLGSLQLVLGHKCHNKLDISPLATMTKYRTNDDPLLPMANAFNGANGTTHHHWHQWWSPLVTIGAISMATTVPLNGDITVGSPSKGKGSVGNNSDNGDNGKWTSITIGDNDTIVSNVDNG